MKQNKIFDLHCHSSVSDGVLTPTELALRASQQGVSVLALTDHDEVAGLAELKQAATTLDLQVMSGVEISVTWAGETVHIVGLNFDETNLSLINGLKQTRSGRRHRAQQIAEGLERAGISNAYEGALAFVGNPDLISRSHFARYLVQIGVAKSISDVFSRFLVFGKPGYVPMQWASLENAVSWIHQAGGRAVIAHPGRYDYTAMQLDSLFQTFKDLGGEAIEVVTGSHTPDQYSEFATVAKHYGFLASCGSDFHGPGESHIDLGGCPSLPASLVPVWHDWVS